MQRTRIRDNSETLIENIYSDVITPNNILDNLTATVSEHLTQFLNAPNILFLIHFLENQIFLKEMVQVSSRKLGYIFADRENLIKSDNGNLD